MSPDAADRIRGSLLGLAIGDSMGLAADFHRTVRSPWVRARMWEGSAELDRAQVAKPLIPFDTGSVDGRRLAPTDDTETAVLAARAALTTAQLGPDGLFDEWRKHALADEVWTGIAERSAILNARRGQVPPTTGSDNPADASDSAVPAGIAFGLFHVGDPDAAARDATVWSSITHARDGVWAAACAAIAISMLAGGHPVSEALDAAEQSVPDGSWLAAGFGKAAALDPTSVFRELPDLLAAFSPRLYSQSGTAPETLPLAFLLIRATSDRPETSLPLAAMFAREGDSVPAFVGALLGAATGSATFGDRWPQAVDRVEGLFYPSLAGESLLGIAHELATR